MFWRPVAVLLSVVPALGLTALVTAYVHLGHNLNRPIQIILVSLAFLGSWYAAMVWLMGSGSLKHAVSRTWVTARVLGIAGVVLAGLWALGFFEQGLVNVSRIIDGDTLDTSIGRVRLYGIDAPEIGERCSRDATEELRRLAGNRVRVEDGPRPVDRFGRRLAYLYGEDGQSIDAALIAGGYARAWTRDGQHVQRLMMLESRARASGAGCLW